VSARQIDAAGGLFPGGRKRPTEARLAACRQAKSRASEILLRQLTRRFGQLPQAVADRVRAARDADLERWADAVLTANSLEDVLGR